MSLLIYGIGVCRGVAMGKARVLSQTTLDIPQIKLSPDELPRQCMRYKAALTIAKQQLSSIRNHIPEDAPPDIHDFIDSHVLMLQDATFSQGPINIIHEMACNAEWALQIQRDRLVSVFQQMEDEYLKTREDDINYLVGRILSLLVQGPVKGSSALGTALPQLPHVLVAEELSPADLILLKTHGGSGLVVERGGPTSHTAILARGLNIPTVLGAHMACRFFKSDEFLIVDGTQGLILGDVGNTFKQHFYKKHNSYQQLRKNYEQLKTTPTMTQDGEAVTLRANMELPTDISIAQHVAAEGIGLYRTEYLFINRDRAPDESEQLHAYLDAIAAMAPQVVTIRTFDLGNDKQPPSMKANMPQDDNPALGLRAIRLSLNEPNLFRPQLKAILRASALGKVRLMLPMVSCPSELTRVLSIVNGVKQELSTQGFAYDPNIEIGSMIEVPSAALTISHFTDKLDFISIGTNDLIQYTLAIDRGSEHVNYLYNPIHPAVLKLIKMSIDAANHASIPVSLCGEMAGDVRYTRLLLAMGLREFSMHPNALLEVKHAVHNTSLNEELMGLVNRLYESYIPSDSEYLLDEINKL